MTEASSNQTFQWGKRPLSAAIFIASVSLLAVAASLTADPAGHGTHEQLGLPPCGFLTATGFPCATCGMTTAFSHAAHGRILTSFITQPAGAVLSLLTAMLAILSGYTLWHNLELGPLLNWMWQPRTLVGFLILCGLAWAYKIARVTYGLSFFP